MREQERKYPEMTMFGELPAWGFYVRHVKGLTLKDIRIKYRKEDIRPALVFDDVDGLNLHGVTIGLINPSVSAVFLQNTKKEVIDRVSGPDQKPVSITRF